MHEHVKNKKKKAKNQQDPGEECKAKVRKLNTAVAR